MEVMYPRCAGLDVHKETVVACVRLAAGSDTSHVVRTFATTAADLIELSEWLEENGCTHVAMEPPECTGSQCGRCWQTVAAGTFYNDLGPTHFDRRCPETQARRLIKRLAELGFSVELKSMATAS